MNDDIEYRVFCIKKIIQNGDAEDFLLHLSKYKIVTSELQSYAIINDLEMRE